MQVILLVNLGSPNNLTLSSIRSFLRKFLGDKRVVNLPRILWYPVLYGIILPIRARQLLKQYQHIWLNDYSPLIYYTREQGLKLQRKLKDDQVVVSAFSYSNPDIGKVLYDMHRQYTVDKLTILPLYPQFSSTTTAAVFYAVAKFYTDKKYLPRINFIRDFYDNIHYIAAVAKSIAGHFAKHGKSQRLVFSYHSLPVKIIKSGDRYYEQCLKSSELIAARLNLSANEYMITFQSRFGGGKWLSPATITTMVDLACSGIKNIAIVCPGFISDCLETLEEINVTNRNIFMNNGGSTYHYISCLNDSDQCIELLYQLAKE